MVKLQRVAVFCGSSNNVERHYLDLAAEVGQALAHDRIELVYGGGHSGLMGAVAQATMEAGGEVTGVIPDGLFANGVDEDQVTSLEVVADMHARKARMYELSDGFIGLPGGLGTFEEVFEAATWTQLGLHVGGRPKTVALLDRDGFWDPVFALLANSSSAGLLKDRNRSIIQPAATVAVALAMLSSGLENELPDFVNSPNDGA